MTLVTVVWFVFFVVVLVSGPVTEFALSYSDTRVQISWMPPDMPNGLITGYYLRLLDLKNFTTILLKNVSANDETSYSQSGLSKPMDTGYLKLIFVVVII